MRSHVASLALVVSVAFIPLPAGGANPRLGPAGRRRGHPRTHRKHFSGIRRQGSREARGDAWRRVARLYALVRPYHPRPRRVHDGSHLSTEPAEEPGHGRLPHRRVRHRVLRRYRRRVVPGGSGPAARNGEEYQKLTFIDVYHKDPAGWIQVASNTSLHPDAVFEMASQRRQLDESERAELMKAREAVWRAWFAGDEPALRKLLPPELITIEPHSETFGSFTSTLEGSRGFAAGGGKLTRLAFPSTEVQVYGNTAVLYTSYKLDLQSGGQTRSERGMATEAFVLKDGQWLNTGWQLAPSAR